MKKLKVVTESLQIKLIEFNPEVPLYRVVMIVPPNATKTIRAFEFLLEEAQILGPVNGGLRLCSELWLNEFPQDWRFIEATSKEKPGSVDVDMGYLEFKAFRAGSMARLSILLQLNTAKGVDKITVELKSMQLIEIKPARKV
jgi:hypothetical protein